ncbi:hypothetical protein DFH06DRAFT_1184647 [Mycena polygramma]|nr:hypothetical protein DFH06DRAFT_1184604 [Mycena polygramma]KAJ7666737.1 hypothetical protein DFH06DRAFT_1184647 [Mycena polygramma]
MKLGLCVAASKVAGPLLPAVPPAPPARSFLCISTAPRPLASRNDAHTEDRSARHPHHTRAARSLLSPCQYRDSPRPQHAVQSHQGRLRAAMYLGTRIRVRCVVFTWSSSLCQRTPADTVRGRESAAMGNRDLPRHRWLETTVDLRVAGASRSLRFSLLAPSSLTLFSSSKAHRPFPLAPPRCAQHVRTQRIQRAEGPLSHQREVRLFIDVHYFSRGDPECAHTHTRRCRASSQRSSRARR